jgi:hypothetical protein
MTFNSKDKVCEINIVTESATSQAHQLYCIDFSCVAIGTNNALIILSMNVLCCYKNDNANVMFRMLILQIEFYAWLKFSLMVCIHQDMHS